MEATEKIRITSKALASGKHQVKFFVEDEQKPQYGYLLVTEPKPVGEIIEQIKVKLEIRKEKMGNLNPFFPVAPMEEDPNCYLFSA